ncbi:MAG: DUF2007 domain-containing protein [Myxococcales bacterium]|nr:DUF2007 domain-containing protein [Myxococcales bacterium]
MYVRLGLVISLARGEMVRFRQGMKACRMVRVYSGRVAVMAYIVKSALEGGGIYAEIRNELASQLVGGIPLDQGYIEVWVREEDERRSLAVIKTILSDDEKGSLSVAQVIEADDE